MLEDVTDMVAHCSYCVQPFFWGGIGELVVVIEVHGAWIKAIEASA